MAKKNHSINYKVAWTEEKKAKAIQLLTDYFEQHGTGESIHQSDQAQEDCLMLVTDIADDVLGDEGLEWID